MWLLHKFRYRAENGEIIRRLRPPYLLLPNHTCVFDPFIVNSLIPRPVHYLVTDASFRSRLVAFGLSLVGGIPKTKTMSDMDAIKNVMRVKDAGGIIGIFPEGQNTWDGHSLPLVPGTAKLAKLLRIPVVTARVNGAYFSKPRWGKSARRGRVNVRFDLALTPEQLKAATPAEIDGRIRLFLENDEYEYNREKQIRFLGQNRAEYLERALFICPSCNSIGTLHSHGDDFTCTSCEYSVHYTLTGMLRANDGKLRFDTIRSWNLWQIDEYRRQLSQYLRNGEPGPFLTDSGVRVQIGYRSRPLKLLGTGDLELRRDLIVFRAHSGEGREFEIRAIRGSNVQNDEHWEFYAGADLYKVTILDPRGCTYKWHLAVELLSAPSNKNPTVQ